MSTHAVPRLALAFAATGALAGGAWVAEYHAPHPVRSVVDGPHGPHVSVDRSQVAVTPTTVVAFGGYSRTSSATPLV